MFRFWHCYLYINPLPSALWYIVACLSCVLFIYLLTYFSKLVVTSSRLFLTAFELFSRSNVETLKLFVHKLVLSAYQKFSSNCNDFNDKIDVQMIMNVEIETWKKAHGLEKKGIFMVCWKWSSVFWRCSCLYAEPLHSRDISRMSDSQL